MRVSPAVVVLVTALACLPASIAHAGRVPLGLRLGWSAAHLTDSFGDAIGPDFRQDFTVAALARPWSRSGFSFQPEIGWMTKGGEGDLAFTITTGGQTTRYDYQWRMRVPYVEAPLLVRFDVPSRRAVAAYLLMGPGPAVRVGDPETEVQSGGITGSATAAHPTRMAAQIFEDVGTFDNPFDASSFDLGMVGGAGIAIGRGPARLEIEARYTHGLLDVATSDHVQVRNAAFAVTAAIIAR